MTKEERINRKNSLKAMTEEERNIFIKNEREEHLKLFAEKEAEHKEKIDSKRKSIYVSQNKWNIFWFNFSQITPFQAIRKWWYKYSCMHPVAAEWLWKIFFFIVFSEGVTIWQYVVMTFLPYAFADLNNGPWGWPGIKLSFAGDQKFMLFGDANGFGYFLAFEIAVFTAQCINFPLQRNITYKSHGNPWWQGMWYFIGWIIISLLVNAVWGFVNCFMLWWKVPEAISGLIKTFITGGLSMFVFFFIFMIIFPSDKMKEETK